MSQQPPFEPPVQSPPPASDSPRSVEPHGEHLASPESEQPGLFHEPPPALEAPELEPAAQVRPEAALALSAEVPPPGPEQSPEPASAGLLAPAVERPAPLLAAAHDPAADYAAKLQPEAGVPLVDGPPASVAAPVAAQRINTLFGIGAVILLVVTLVVVILLAIFVINLLATR